MYGRRAYHDPWLLAGVDDWLARHALSALLARMADIGYEPRPLPLDMVERADPRPRRSRE